MGDDHAVSTQSVQRDPGEKEHSQHRDGAADELIAEIRNLREEVAGLRAEVDRLSTRLTEREVATDRAPERAPVPGLVGSLRSNVERWWARWIAYRRRFQPEWAPGGLRWDILTAGVIVLLAGVLRFYHLTTIPLG